MQLRHVLAVVDFSCLDAGLPAVWRAAHLARAHAAELALFCLVEPEDARPASRFGATAPPARARADLLHLAGGIREALGLVPAVVVGVGEEGRATLQACVRRADLLVTGAGPRSAAVRWARAQGVPVLLARMPPPHVHRSALVVHEPGVAALRPLLGAARWLCRPEGLQALRLMDRRPGRLLQATDQPAPALQALKQLAQQAALHRLRDELAAAGLRPEQGQVLPAPSPAAVQHAQRRHQAQLLVLGQRRAPRGWDWRDWLSPGLGRALVAAATGDLLLVPGGLPTAKEARFALHQARCDGLLGTPR
ncbi:hypothetical protein [Xenophilus sp. Marseille-Q4582]|uniref:hypothetical protein n=1 Tax=Xenophilus sp. Marseille-Q4582 TaxID=2866600 RepID=UPI001CE40238|nr:hypothetical protein [Xenophilus sp. Marseille-Q4582]